MPLPLHQISATREASARWLHCGPSPYAFIDAFGQIDALAFGSVDQQSAAYGRRVSMDRAKRGPSPTRRVAPTALRAKRALRSMPTAFTAPSRLTCAEGPCGDVLPEGRQRSLAIFCGYAKSFSALKYVDESRHCLIALRTTPVET